MMIGNDEDDDDNDDDWQGSKTTNNETVSERENEGKWRLEILVYRKKTGGMRSS